MIAPVFVDTNVLVYRFDSAEPEKQRRAEAWLDLLWAEGQGRLSWQVVQELYVNVTRRLPSPMPAAEARSVVRSLLAWRPSPTDDMTLQVAWTLEDRFSLSWWDALIVAAAQRSGCAYLLSEGLQAGQRFDGLVVIDPFRTLPEDLR